MAFSSFTYPELVVLRRALAAQLQNQEVMALLRTCNEEVQRRRYPSIWLDRTVVTADPA